MDQHRALGRPEPVEVFEPLALLELGVQGERGDAEEREQGEQAPDAVDGGEEDQRTSGVAQEEVV